MGRTESRLINLNIIFTPSNTEGNTEEIYCEKSNLYKNGHSTECLYTFLVDKHTYY